MGNSEFPDLPDWVGWVAQDADGAWWAYEAEPNQHDIGWYENEVGRILHLAQGAPNPCWRDSLRRVGAVNGPGTDLGGEEKI